MCKQWGTWLVLLAFIYSLTGHATTTFWTDCSLPVYGYPYGLEKQPVILKYLNDGFMKEYMQKKNLEWKEIEAKLGKMPSLNVEDQSLSNEDLKKIATQAFDYIAIKKQLAETPHYKNIQSERVIQMARFLLVHNLFQEAGLQVKKEEDISANFMNATLSRCEYDEQLMNKVVQRTLANIKLMGSAK